MLWFQTFPLQVPPVQLLKNKQTEEQIAQHFFVFQKKKKICFFVQTHLLYVLDTVTSMMTHFIVHLWKSKVEFNIDNK